MPPKKIEKISVTLDKILASRGMGSRLKEFRVFGRWDKIVGRVISRHAQPLSLRGKKLTIAVDSSSWMQQLSMLKPEIIEKVNKGLGKESVQSITLKLGEVAASAPAAGERAPSASLGPDERNKIENYVQRIKDTEVREALRHLMEKDFLSRKREK